MPGRLTVFRSVTLPLTADDLALPALFALGCRLGCLIGAIVLLGYQQAASPITSDDTLFQSLTLAAMFASIFLYLRLWLASSSGQILDWQDRTASTTRAWHRLAVYYIFELALGCYGIYVMTLPVHNITVLVTTVSIFIDIGLLFVLISILIMITRGKKPRPMSHESVRDKARFYLWLLSLCCCKLFGTLHSPVAQDNDSWSEIARVVHGFLKDMLSDFTVSDFFAAFILVMFEQRAQEQNRLGASPTIPPNSPQIKFKAQTMATSVPIDSRGLKDLDDFDRFGPLMLGVYGWKLSLFMNPSNFCINYPFYLMQLAGGCSNDFEDGVFNHIAGIDGNHKRVLYSSWTSYMAEAIPYVLVLDHTNRALVVVLRGTMSVGDIATDLMASPALLGDVGRAWGVPDSDKHYAHAGMLRVAHRIRADIEHHQLLHRLLKPQPEDPESLKVRQSLGSSIVTDADRESFLRVMKKKSRPRTQVDRVQPPEDEATLLMAHSETLIGNADLAKLDCNNYRLVVCGHSLGSCVASILSLLLRPRFPQIECLAYSCVSGIFSRELAELSAAWITSISVGKDLFGRLSWHSAKALRDRLLDVLRRSKTAKHKVILSLFSRHVKVEDLLYPPDQVPEEGFRVAVRNKIAFMNSTSSGLIDEVRLTMPGRIIYLEKLHTETHSRWFLCSRKHRHYQAVVIQDRMAMQDEILISTRLLLDHMPDFVCQLIPQVLADTRADPLRAHLSSSNPMLSTQIHV